MNCVSLTQVRMFKTFQGSELEVGIHVYATGHKREISNETLHGKTSLWADENIIHLAQFTVVQCGIIK